MRIAYVVNVYPKVSHSFIRRELLELEARGHDLVRVSIRPVTEPLVEAMDCSEREKTYYLLSDDKLTLLKEALRAWGRDFGAVFKSLIKTIQIGFKSDRGLLRHFAYFIEASVLSNRLFKDRVDHIHAHFGTNSAAVAMLCHLQTGIPYSFTVHGPDEFDSPRGISLGEKIKHAKFVVAITSYCTAQLMRWTTPDNWKKIKIVGCTVNESFFDEQKPIPEDSKMLVNVGRLSGQKGQLILLDAFAGLLNDGYEAELVMVGDGELRELIEYRIDELEIREHVTITGWMDEGGVRKHLLNSRGLVMASFAEGLPVVIMESMAMGRPVVSTDIAGISELVVNDETGFLVSASTVNPLKEAMKKLLDMPIDELDVLVSKGRSWVRRDHDLAKETGKLESLIAEKI